MWLPDAQTHQLDCDHQPDPLYARVFQSWPNQEIALSDLKVSQTIPCNAPIFSKCARPKRIFKACAEVEESGLQKLWVDSLWVDWLSSEQLSENISSIFHIYRGSQVCFAYVGDSDVDKKSLNNPGRYFKHNKCRDWLWVPQELVAAPEVFCYNQSWQQIGSRDFSIFALSGILYIDDAVLQNSTKLSAFTIGRKMSWAALLSTHPPDDIKHTLLGILNMQMPISFSDQKEVFLRLQEQILKDTNHSKILFWRPDDHQQYQGLLACSLSQFSHLRNAEDCGPLRIRGNPGPSSPKIFIKGLFYLHQTSSELLLWLIGRGEHATKNVIGIPLKALQHIYARSTPYLALNAEEIPSGIFMGIRVSRAMDGRIPSIISTQFPPPIGISWLDLQEDRVSSHQPVTNSDSQKTKLSDEGCSPFINDFCPSYSGLGRLITPNISKTRSFQGDREIPPEHIVNGQTMHQPLHRGSNGAFLSLNDNFPSRKRRLDVGHTPVGLSIEEFVPKSLHSRPETPIPNHDIISAMDMRLLVDRGLRAFTGWYVMEGNNPGQPEALSSRPTKRRKTSRFENQIGTSRVTGKEISGNLENMFACPFQLQNTHKYWLCLKHGGFSTLHRLKQHLLSEHQRPYNCPICRETFNLASVRDEHIIEGRCVPDAFPEIEGLTSAQIIQISRRTVPSQSKDKQWHSIWDTLFHDVEPPATIYTPVRITHYIRSMERFWSRRGRETLLKVMGSEDFEGQIINMITGDALTDLNKQVLDQMVSCLLEVYVTKEDFFQQTGQYFIAK